MPDRSPTRSRQAIAERDAELALVRQVRNGDESAWPPLIALHERRVIGTLVGLTGNVSAAEEIAQDTFVTAWFSLGKLRDDRAFGGWLLGIARNRYREWVRDRKKHGGVLPDENLVGEGTGDSAIDQRRAGVFRELFRLIDDLPDPYGELLRLRYYDGFSCADIADRLSRPLNTVTKQISRAHALVADRLARLRGHTTTLAGWLPLPGSRSRHHQS